VTSSLGLRHRGLADPVLAGLVPAMLADQVGGDPVQPGPGIRVAEVIPVPLGERGQERLGDQIIGNLTAGTPGKVAVICGACLSNRTANRSGSRQELSMTAASSAAAARRRLMRDLDSCPCPSGCSRGYICHP